MKSTQRLDYNRFAEALVERGLVDRETISHILQQAGATGTLITDLLVKDNVLSDWEVARVCCEVFGLPFISVDGYAPSQEAFADIDPNFMHQYGLVPLDRFGKLLTVAMPGFVPTEVLDAMAGGQDLRVVPLVGSVVQNRQWLESNLSHAPLGASEEVDAPLPVDSDVELVDDDWGDIFDAGDEAVQLDLQDRDQD